MIPGGIFMLGMLLNAWGAAENGRSTDVAVFVAATAVSYMLGLILDEIKKEKK